MYCNGFGNPVKTKYTPEMNWRISATGVTTAGADLPVRATDEKALPRIEPTATPSTVTQSRVTQRCQSVGSLTLLSATEMASRVTISSTTMTSTMSTL